MVTSDPQPPEAPDLKVSPTGQVHDGDTFKLSTGANARLLGVDAFELNQTGRASDGSITLLGANARSALFPFAKPGSTVTPTGDATYGRPVVTLNRNGDAGEALLDQGLAIAEPRYLSSLPTTFKTYMEAERLARLNRRGAWATEFKQPSSFRHGTPDPWAKAEFKDKPVEGGTAVFFDDPTPFQGLRPEIAEGYQTLLRDPTAKAADVLAYATANGFKIDPTEAEKFIQRRDQGVKTDYSMRYAKPAPRVLTDLGDGRTGATARGVADPINMLDEMGAVVDSVVPGTGRENVWDSDRRFGDILHNNLDQNRSILANDEAEYPWWRFGGQLASGLVLPGASVEGVGFAAARKILAEGGTRFAAEQAARRAVVSRLGVAGTVEGAAAGAGAGETWQERVQGAAIGAPVGLALGAGTGVIAPKVAQIFGKPFSKMAGTEGERVAGDFTDGAVDTARAGAQNDFTTTGRVPPPPERAALASERVEIGSLTPRQQPTTLDDGRKVYPGELYTLPREDLEGLSRTAPREQEVDEGVISREQAAEVLREHQDYGAFDDANLADVVRRTLIEQRSSRWLKRVQEGTAHSGEQAAAVRMMGALGALKERGRSLGELAPQIKASLVEQGWNPADADEVLGARLSALGRREIDNGPTTQAMANETETPTLVGPDVERKVDRIDLRSPAHQLLRNISEAQRTAQAARMQSSDVLPLAANAVDGVEEAVRIDAGRIVPVKAPNESDALVTRNVPSPRDASRTIPKKGPLDLVTWLRTQGGLKPAGGEFEWSGIDNTSRKLDFAAGENRFGPLVSEAGMNFDDAAQRATSVGYFDERPSVWDFIEAVKETHAGRGRVFHPDDYAEIDDFLTHRGQRESVEAAKQEGVPLSVDRGEPVDLADLDRNAAPVTAYEEWGENAPNLAGNIRLDKLDSPQAIKRALVATHQQVGGFDAATRGRITQAETARLASELGMTADDLLKRRKGQAFNAEEALASRQILARSTTDLVNMAKTIAREGNHGDQAEALFKQAWVRHVAIQEQVAGMTAEAGRVLSSFRMMADARQVARVLPNLGDIGGGSQRLKEAAEMIVDLERQGVGPGGIAKFAAKTLQTRKRDVAMEWYYNALLSGPQTHATNILSNTLTAIGQIPEYAVAATLGAGRRVFQGPEADRVLFSEVGARAVGMMQGTREGLRQALKTFVTGNPSDGAAKVEMQVQRAIPGPLGSIIRTPTRALAAEDEFFKAIARRMALNGLATRQVGMEGLTGPNARTRIADLVANPTDALADAAYDYGRYLTFQAPLGAAGRSIAQFTDNMPVAKLIVPFTRTPINIFKFVLERSPAAPVLGEWKRELAAGGARRDVAMAKMLVGSGIGATMVQLAAEGHITGGGPADDSAKRLKQADGWQPYSFKVGDKYYSYSRLDPYAMLLGISADMVDLQSAMTDKQRESTATLVAASVASNLANKTWLTGVSNMVEALKDPERSMDRFISGMVASVAVPAVVGQTARTVDPVLREARGPLDTIRSRVPGMSSSLLPRRDVLGQEIRREGGVGSDLVSPIASNTGRNNPVVKRLLDAGVSMAKPQRPKMMSDVDYDRYQEMAGVLTMPKLSTLMSGPGWRAMNPEEREAAAEKAIRDARKLARTMIGAGKPASSMRQIGTNVPPPPPPGFTIAP